MQPTLIIGKTGTGKTKKACDLLPANPIHRYADEYDIEDNFSIPVDRGILIEEVEHKPKTKLICDTLLQYKGKIVLTSVNRKDVPKKILNMCKAKLSGNVNHAYLELREVAPNCDSEPETYVKNAFELLHTYLKNPYRDKVVEIFKLNKPSDVQMLTWLATNVHPNKLAYVDGRVKRKWSSDYFYELLVYAHSGRISRGVDIPSRRKYDKRPSICRKLGLRPNEWYLLESLKKDPELANWLRKKLGNEDRRYVGLKDKIRIKVSDTHKQMILEDF